MVAILRAEPSFTVGVEEEYLLVHKDSLELAEDPPQGMLDECAHALDGGTVSPEFLRSQIEVGTKVCRDYRDLYECLRTLRRRVGDVTGRHGLAPIAASTHPSARWMKLKHTDKDRYNDLSKDLQQVVRRLVICGMHVHVGIDDQELRIDLLNQVSYFLPHILALSTSSPFWGGENTGLKSYRISVFKELPRTGLPERFDSWGEYQRLVSVLVGAGMIEDASKIWWDVRPSQRFPTLEMRVADVCTRVEDAVTVAALFACILRMLWRLRRGNQRWRIYANMLIEENRWRAQRYGIDEGLIDYGIGQTVPYADLLEEIIHLTREDAQVLGCTEEVAHARTIIARGTSAHRQVAVYQKALADGAEPEEALRAVVRHLVAETLEGV